MVKITDPITKEYVFLDGERAARYLAELRPLTTACPHPTLELRRRQAAIAHQCLDCGAQVGGAVKRQPIHQNLADFNNALEHTFAQRRETALRALAQRYLEEERRVRAVREGMRHVTALEYAQYLRTPEWQIKRQRVLRRAGGVCEGCLVATATQVHHKDYRHVRDELLFDLVAVCSDCHRKAHPDKHEFDFLYEDFSPCSSCRWDNGGIYCLKFDIETYKAFEPAGPCYPPGAGREELK